MLSGYVASFYSGPEVVVSHLLGKDRVQIRFPCSKRKRIQRKWAKNPESWLETWKPAIYQIGNTIYCDPVSYAKLAKELGVSR